MEVEYMNLASEMRNLTNVSQSADEVLMSLYQKTISRIKDAAYEGKNELCWYDAASEVVYKDEYRKYRDKLKDKLVREGFRIKKGIELGKGMGSWETPYVVW